MRTHKCRECEDGESEVLLVSPMHSAHSHTQQQSNTLQYKDRQTIPLQARTRTQPVFSLFFVIFVHSSFFPALSFISSPEKVTTHTVLLGIGSAPPPPPPPLPFVHIHARIYVSSNMHQIRTQTTLPNTTRRHTHIVTWNI